MTSDGGVMGTDRGSEASHELLEEDDQPQKKEERVMFRRQIYREMKQKFLKENAIQQMKNADDVLRANKETNVVRKLVQEKQLEEQEKQEI